MRGSDEPFDPITRRVREALYVATGRVLDETPHQPGSDRRKLGQSISRRLSGKYGAAVRDLADRRAGLTADELVAVVIAPTELPRDQEAAELALRVQSGVRDRARRSRYGDPADLSLPIPPDLPERIEELRRCAREGMAAQEARPHPEPQPFVREYSVVPRFVYEALRRPPVAPVD